MNCAALQSPIELANSGRFVRKFQLNMYIPVCHTNKRPIQNVFGVVTNRLVGIGL